MPKKMEANESELLAAFDKGELKSVASKAELAKLKAAARATALKEEARPNKKTLAAVSQAVAGKASKVSLDRL